MRLEIYDQLANALDKLPNGFPRTASGVELELLKRIFTREEAAIACKLSYKMESYIDIAANSGCDLDDVKERLIQMAQKGQLWTVNQNGVLHFRLAPWIVGIYEAQNRRMDYDFAHLVEAYFHEGGMKGLMTPIPAFHRVIPAQSAVKSEWILPYDDVKAVLNASTSFHVTDCICRKQQDFVGRKCDFPLDICFSFSAHARAPRSGDISKEEALALLDKAEQIGLVHTVSNVMEGLAYVCNCCGCCCAILRGVTEFGMEQSVAHASYFGMIDEDTCVGCGVCTTRCHMDAITLKDDIAVIEKDKCIGCGLCVTRCPTDAARLELKPEDQRIDPPINFQTWETERLRNRGLL